MEKSDLTKIYKTYFKATTKPEVVEIGPAQFLSISGKGDPSGKAFSEKIQALFTTAYVIKFFCKARGNDFVVSKLEGLWWYDESKFESVSMDEAPEKISRSEWEYRLLIRMPDFVTSEDLKNGIEVATSRKNIAMAKEVSLYNMHEGKSVQMLHVGPFTTEIDTLKQMNELILREGFAKNGFHHEIYLSDFRKTDPAKLKTILREPVK